MKIKGYIAQSFCWLVVFLITSNIGFSAVHFNPFQENTKRTILNTSTQKLSFHSVEDTSGDQIISLIKDQQEFDADLFLSAIEHSATLFYFYHLKSNPNEYFIAGTPLYNVLPLWITNLQILL